MTALRHRYYVDYIDRNGNAMVDMVWAGSMDEALGVFLWHRQYQWPPARGIEVHDWDAVKFPDGMTVSRRAYEFAQRGIAKWQAARQAAE